MARLSPDSGDPRVIQAFQDVLGMSGNETCCTLGGNPWDSRVGSYVLSVSGITNSPSQVSKMVSSVT